MCRSGSVHASEAEDEVHEPIPSNAERGPSQCQSPEEPTRGWEARGTGETGEETVSWQEQTW